MIFVTADNHFDHANIIGYCGRPFGSTEEMNEALISNWNNVVGKRDQVYVLGDFVFGRGHRHPRVFRERLNGQIHMILGSHDKEARIREAGFVEVAHYKELKVGGNRFVLFHWPIESWQHKQHLNVYHLHGHSHGKSRPCVRRLDVGVDVHQYRPLSVEEALEKILKVEEG